MGLEIAAVAGVVSAAVGVGSAAYSIVEAENAKADAKKKARIQKQQAELQKRIEEAKLRREKRIRAAKFIAATGNEGAIGSSGTEDALTSLETSLGVNIKYLQSQTDLQKDQYNEMAESTIDRLTASQISSVGSGFKAATDLYTYGTDMWSSFRNNDNVDVTSTAPIFSDDYLNWRQKETNY